MSYTPRIWRHRTQRATFTLAVDNFGIKYFRQDDLAHLSLSLRKHYTIKVDREGKNYCGLKIDWDYEKERVDISMMGSVPKALYKYQHPPPKIHNIRPIHGFPRHMARYYSMPFHQNHS